MRLDASNSVPPSRAQSAAAIEMRIRSQPPPTIYKVLLCWYSRFVWERRRMFTGTVRAHAIYVEETRGEKKEEGKEGDARGGTGLVITKIRFRVTNHFRIHCSTVKWIFHKFQLIVQICRFNYIKLFELLSLSLSSSEFKNSLRRK